MSDVAKRQERSEEQKEQEKTKKELNPEWSQDAQDELQDFIESQGIYIRQEFLWRNMKVAFERP